MLSTMRTALNTMSRARSRVLLSAVLFLFFSYCYGEFHVDSEPNDGTVTVQLKVEAKSEGAFAELTFLNTSSSEEASLYKYNTCLENRIRNNVFKIESEGQAVQYIGRLAKRPDPKPEDFAKLPPHATLSCVVRLDDAYRFLPGSHSYEIEYFALHPFPGKSGYMKLRSNRVRFVYAPLK